MSSLPSLGALAISRPLLPVQQPLHIILYTLQCADVMTDKQVSDFDGILQHCDALARHAQKLPSHCKWADLRSSCIALSCFTRRPQKVL